MNCPPCCDLMDEEGVDKFYLSHLNYAGRGNNHRGGRRPFRHDAVGHGPAVRALLGAASSAVTARSSSPATTMPTAFICCMWAAERFPERVAHLRAKLEQWGGNSSGVNVANIDNLGQRASRYLLVALHARQRARAAVLGDLARPVRPDHGRTESSSRARSGGDAPPARTSTICGGNTRVRALQLTGNPWAEDPGCYLTDEEIGVTNGQPRVQLTPYRSRKSHEVAAD